MKEELLDLSTIVDRETVRIRSKLHPAGRLYEILDPEELGLYQGARVSMCAQAIAGIDFKKQPTPAQERAQRKTFNDLMGIICPSLEPQVLAGLKPVQLLALYGVFAGLVKKGEDSGNPPAAQTSGGSSRASKGSTAATRKRGSTIRNGS